MYLHRIDGGARQLRIGIGLEVLMWRRVCGLWRLEAEALRKAAERFEEFVTTAGFLRIEGVWTNDWLVARVEEVV